MSRKTGNAQSCATLFRHSAVPHLPAVPLLEVPIGGTRLIYNLPREPSPAVVDWPFCNLGGIEVTRSSLAFPEPLDWALLRKPTEFTLSFLFFDLRCNFANPVAHWTTEWHYSHDIFGVSDKVTCNPRQIMHHSIPAAPSRQPLPPARLTPGNLPFFFLRMANSRGWGHLRFQMPSGGGESRDRT